MGRFIHSYTLLYHLTVILLITLIDCLLKISYMRRVLIVI